jgi:hypothetical protein
MSDDPFAGDDRIEKMRWFIAAHDSIEDPALRNEFLAAHGITSATLRSFRGIVTRHDAEASTPTPPSSPSASRVRVLRLRPRRRTGTGKSPRNRTDTTRPGEPRRNRSGRGNVVLVIVVIFEDPK